MVVDMTSTSSASKAGSEPPGPIKRSSPTSACPRIHSPSQTTPRRFFHLYTEKLAQMPHSYFVNDHRQSYPAEFPAAELATRSELGLPTEKFVFASFNQLYKITPGI